MTFRLFLRQNEDRVAALQDPLSHNKTVRAFTCLDLSSGDQLEAELADQLVTQLFQFTDTPLNMMNMARHFLNDSSDTFLLSEILN